MDDLKISFRFDDIGFHEISDLNEANQEKAKQFFLHWEKKVRHYSVIHSLNQELNLDSSKMVQVTLETKKENLTYKG